MQTKIAYTPNKSVNYKGLQKIVSGGQTGNINGAEFKRELIKNSLLIFLGIL
jgi:hypothetical protein